MVSKVSGILSFFPDGTMEYKEKRTMEANMLHLSTKIIGSCAE